jgi:hypothetical protein
MARALGILLIAAAASASEVPAPRYLLPVYPNGQEIVGANGVRWRSRLTVLNNGDEDVILGPCAPGFPGGAACPPTILSFRGHTVLIDPMVGWTAAGAQGRLLYFDERFKPAVKLGLTLLRNDIAVATLPIVDTAALREGSIEILGVPVGRSARILLRIYDLGNHNQGTVRVNIFAGAQTPMYTTAVPLQASSYVDPGGTPYAPAYAEIIIDPDQVGEGERRIQVTTESSGVQLWAFATVTRFDSPAVAVFAPAE